MRQRITVLLVVMSMLLVGVAMVGAAGHDTIVDIAVENDSFDTLAAAVVAAGLADELSTGTWTVFAPTDTAFAKLGLNAMNIDEAFSERELVNILLYHAIPADVSAEQAKAMQGDIIMANGEDAGIKWFDGNLYVNDDAKVIIPDVLAANGRIHAVDTVILGPWPRTAAPAADAPEMDEADEMEDAADDHMEEAAMDEPQAAPPAASGNSIVDIAVADGRFDTLAAAVVAAGLADTLSGGTWTVFAPTDDAFAKLGLNESNIASAFSTAELRNILLYHAVAGDVSQEFAKANQGDIIMANGADAGIKWFAGSLYVNDDAKVIIPDVIADNGRVHAVDTVILGPWPRAED